ncbi:MAG: hypothetical protein ABEH38_07700 [Flavobacteriales bacterium]
MRTIKKKILLGTSALVLLSGGVLFASSTQESSCSEQCTAESCKKECDHWYCSLLGC